LPAPETASQDKASVRDIAGSQVEPTTDCDEDHLCPDEATRAPVVLDIELFDWGDSTSMPTFEINDDEWIHWEKLIAGEEGE
jgi:hypothetical protein